MTRLLLTYTGRSFDMARPEATDFAFEDIAHALSLLCRYNGHVKRFYSVAEHCCHVHDLVANAYPGNRQLARAALLHDAAEAYLGDVVTPLKYQPSFTGYRAAEERVEAALGKAFGFTLEDLKTVKPFDVALRPDEMHQLTNYPSHAFEGEPLGVALAGWVPDDAKAQFLARWDALATA